MEKGETSEIETEPTTGKYVDKRKNNHHAYFSVHDAFPHFFDNCLKLVFAFVNKFK